MHRQIWASCKEGEPQPGKRQRQKACRLGRQFSIIGKIVFFPLGMVLVPLNNQPYKRGYLFCANSLPRRFEDLKVKASLYVRNSLIVSSKPPPIHGAPPEQWNRAPSCLGELLGMRSQKIIWGLYSWLTCCEKTWRHCLYHVKWTLVIHWCPKCRYMHIRTSQHWSKFAKKSPLQMQPTLLNSERG